MHLSIEEALAQLRAGRMIIVTDDVNRENEGDIIAGAHSISAEQVNFIVSEARGLLCVAMEQDWSDRLQLNPMVGENTSLHKTNFTVSVDALDGVTTGISAKDRAKTIRLLASPNSKPEQFGRPGHIFPLVSKPGGVLRRAGHTEAAVDLMKMTGSVPVGVLCEILDEEGESARGDKLLDFAKKHDIGIITIEDLVAYRRSKEILVEKVAVTKLPTKFGYFDLHVFLSLVDKKEHIALVRGDITSPDPVMVRVHDQCLTGDTFGSLRCDCGEQLDRALPMINEEGRGVLLYMAQEGRGIGLINKIKAYNLQDQGYDTVDANLRLGLKADARDYGIGAQILSLLGIRKLKLITNNPKKIVGLTGHGLEIVEQIPIRIQENEYNIRYLKAKKERMGHLL